MDIFLSFHFQIFLTLVILKRLMIENLFRPTGLDFNLKYVVSNFVLNVRLYIYKSVIYLGLYI